MNELAKELAKVGAPTCRCRYELQTRSYRYILLLESRWEILARLINRNTTLII